MSEKLTAAERADIIRLMRVPAITFVLLMGMLAIIVLMGALVPSAWASGFEVFVMVCMIATVLLLSMEVPSEPPLMRLFAGLGFVWVMILFGMTMIDFWTR